MSIPINVRAEIKAGHKVQPDHPALPGVHRWTCEHCGDAVPYYQGEVFGPVTERVCEKVRQP